MVNKKKTLLYILGCAVVGIAALLLVYGILVGAGIVHLKQNRLVFYGDSAEMVYNGNPLTADGWSMVSGELQSGHRAVGTTIGSITLPGEAENRLSVLIYDENGSDVTDEYDIECVSGTLTVLRVPITVASYSAKKQYDGKPLSRSDCYLAYGRLIKGHELHCEAIASITEVGIQENNISVSVIDSQTGEDVTRYYNISKEHGILEIEKRKITVTTASDGKTYDGNPLTNGDFSLVGDLLPGHVGEVHVMGSITLPGKTANNATVKILDAQGKDITSSYEIIHQFGTLSIAPKDDDESEGGGSTGGSGGSGGSGGMGGNSSGGTISGSDLNDKNSSDEESTEFFSFISDFTGNLLLRMKHFGDYDFDGWKEAPTEENAVLFVLAESAVEKNEFFNQISIELLNGCEYIMPYYSEKSTVVPSLKEYTNTFYYFDYTRGNAIELSAKAAAIESAYRPYAYEKYLSLPESTRDAMISIFRQEAVKSGKNPDTLRGRELILWVAQYIKSAGIYNLMFPEYPEGVDTAVYFLTEAKVGCCRHFATSAVAMYRALGIPARYTVGFSAGSVAGKKTTVTGDRAHAWVEVYVDGLGWVTIDPTAGTSGSGSEEQIEPDTIYVKSGDANKYYDGTPLTCNLHEISGLPENYSYEINFLGTQTEIGSSKNLFTIKIFDENGKEVTSEIEVVKKEGTLTVETHKLIIETEGAKKNYNGLPLTNSNYSVSGKLIDGHVLNVTCTGSITDPGTVENEFEYTVTDKDGNDASQYYDVESILGYLTVCTISIDINGLNAEKVYDGEPLTCEEYTVQGGVLPGHTPVLTFTGSRTEPGVSNNPFTCVMIDENGEDVSDKYRIVCHFGYLTVHPEDGEGAIITVSSQNATKVYDGTPLTSNEYRYNPALAKGHRIEYVATGSQTEVGSSKNTFEVKIFEGEVDVTGKYVIIKEEGTLTVEKRPLEIVSESAEKIYDGKPLTCETVIYSGEIAENQTIKVTVTGSQTEKGSSPNTFEYVITDIDGNDVTKNYDVTEKLGTLSVISHTIKVSSASAQKIYDGTPLRNGEYSVEGEIPEGHEVKVDVTGFRVEPGTSENDLSVIIMDSEGNDVSANYEIELNPGKLTVISDTMKFVSATAEKTYDGIPLEAKDDPTSKRKLPDGWRAEFNVTGSQSKIGSSENVFSVIIYDESGKDVTSELKITKEYGILTVYPIYIVIETGGAEKEYDGKPLTDEYCVMASGHLLNGHSISLKATGSQTDVGSSKNTFEAIVTDEKGNDVSEYYYFGQRLGTLKVTKIKIDVRGLNAGKVYDGTPLNKGEYRVDGNLSEGHEVKVGFTASITEVGSCEGTFNVKILDSEGNDVTRNYQIDKTFGTFTVKPIKLQLKTESAEKQYDGTPLTAFGWELISGEPLTGHKMDVKNVGSQTKVGESDNITVVTITDARGITVTHNYEIQINPGKLVVTMPEDQGDGSGGGFGDQTGDMNDKSPIPDVALFKFTSNVSGKLLLMGKVYGDYRYDGWGAAPAGEDKSTGSLLLTSSALQGNGSARNNIKITNIMEVDRVIPSYPSTINPSGNYTDGSYRYYFYSYNYTTSGYVPVASSKYLQYEKTYKNYVYSNYTELPSDTKAAMLEIFNAAVKEYGLNVNNMSKQELVAWVESYIKISAEYNMQFPDYPANVDIAVYFLTVAKSGVCRHFATAATAMYRALGIPARYVAGYSVNSEPNKTITVKSENAHAWVEVYIDGLGWVNVDPTGSASQGGGDEDYEQIYELTVKSGSSSKTYDGTDLTFSGYEILAGSLAQGHFIRDTYTGKQKNVGVSENTWNISIVDMMGRNVIGMYKITKLNGSLTVTPKKISIIPDTESVIYTGTEYKAGKGEITQSILDENGNSCVINDELIPEYVGSITDIGSVETWIRSVIAVDDNGNDVSYNYEFDYSARGRITVVPRSLKVTSESYSKVFDGKTISCERYNTSGSAHTLLSGHTLKLTFSKAGSAIAVYKNSFTAKVLDASGNDVSENYSIEKIFGELIIAYSELTFVTDSISKVYDGKPLSATGTCNFISNNLMPGHRIVSQSLNVEVTEPGYALNIPTIKVVDSAGKDYTWMYIIGTEQLGTVTVTKRDLLVTSASVTEEYDPGRPDRGLSSKSFTQSGLVSGHRLEVAISGYIDTIGSCDNQIDDVKVFDANGRDVTHCYNITKKNGILSIIP